MYWVLGRHPWNKRVFDETISQFPGEWRYVGDPEELTLEAVQQDNPEKLFFMHWSWKVPKEITDNYECIAFHPSNLPRGRGGSPVQNQIIRGAETTKVTAFRMIEEIDAGPVYLRSWLSLAGTAESIYVKMSEEVAEMIEYILAEEVEPVAQEGGAWHVYSRRTPDMSELHSRYTLEEMYDFIRMLDAEGYPKAFLNIGNYRYEFDHALMYDNRVEAHVTITKVNNES